MMTSLNGTLAQVRRDDEAFKRRPRRMGYLNTGAGDVTVYR